MLIFGIKAISACVVLLQQYYLADLFLSKNAKIDSDSAVNCISCNRATIFIIGLAPLS